MIVAQARKVLDQTDVEQIIPTGTVLQNLRTSSLNNDMDLTRDGYHMDYGLSRYAAACAVFESIISPSSAARNSTATASATTCRVRRTALIRRL